MPNPNPAPDLPDDRTVTFGGSTFTINKMMPRDAKRVFLGHVRPLLSGLAKGELTKDSHDLQFLAGLIANAPTEHIDGITDAMYQRIFYARDGGDPRRLAGDEDSAFQDMDMAHILMLDWRAFLVNFRESWDVLQSQFPQVGQVLQSLAQETSIPSSHIQ